MSERSIQKDSRAQTSIEYLLIIAGAVIIVLIVAFVMKSIAQSANTQVSEQAPKTG